ncbi:3-phosphoshikimate 1-carboxyvinyltransferase [Sphingobacterium sp. 1.A.4]|uniref:3-phosphoshikimate 1-carboxyvinyltransferase n=1 Tax=Sphingobacterium sp. 1.A.4 TaxID=2044603 RepID=UPI000C0BEEF7|nr:3-phosphoshikimate 1-carboxyvinyltransferase [Sphingobacterium sp. 1.A.4]
MTAESIVVKHPSKNIKGTVQLTGSKSESNRALIIQALSKGLVKVENLSEAADTVTLNAALTLASNASSSNETLIDIGPAGTAMRFLTSYLNLIKGNFILTGTERMQLRPIGILVDALKDLGADIHYQKKSGFPPLKIEGGMIQGKEKISIQGNVSSQYISSLLLIAANLKKGLTIDIQGELTSRPYVTMTLEMLKECGIDYSFTENQIHIAKQDYQETTIYVEPDWSAASYWYAIVALSENGHIVLPGLKEHSLQGDMAIVEIMSHFGVSSSFEQDGLHLRKTTLDSEKTYFDFKECPDLAQTVVVVAAALKKDVTFTGLETLKIKETDRILALQTEIAKFGAQLEEDQQDYHLKTSAVFTPETVTFGTYEDHRMAMAFAPLAMVFPEVIIEEPMVVEKSYPEFWKHLKAQGFEIND